MAQLKSPPTPSPTKAPQEASEETCPRCGQPLRAGYSCGCPERWENEGGATAPGDRKTRPTRKT